MIEAFKNEAVRRGLSLAALVALGGMGTTACGEDTPSGPGYDVSYPQCSTEDSAESIDLPEARSFAIVGLNAGLAKSYNPCFVDQMQWASESAGDKGQPRASIYINAGNPGRDNAAQWPQSGEFQGVPCTGEDSQACAFIYGKSLIEWNLDTFMDRYGEGHDVEPEDFKWWIDVEVGNSWQCNAGLSPLCAEEGAVEVESGALSRNAAVIHGMVTQLQSNGIEAGIYTNPNQWNLIVANTIETLPEYAASRDLDVWVAGARDEQQAIDACNQPRFGGLGEIVLSQYNPDTTKILDKNVVC